MQKHGTQNRMEALPDMSRTYNPFSLLGDPVQSGKRDSGRLPVVIEVTKDENRSTRILPDT